jgi:hypothetical protein
VLKVYQNERSSAVRARLKLTAFCTLARSVSSSIGAAISDARRSSSGDARTGSAGAATTCSDGSGPGAKRTFATPSRVAISAPRCPSSNAQIESVVETCSVPSRAIRAGHALRAIAAPATSGQRSTRSARPDCAPNRASSPRSSLDSLSRGHLHDLGGLDRQGRALGGRDDSLLHPGNALGEHAAAPDVELGENVVE